MKQKSSGKVMALTGACIGTAAIVGPAVGGAMAARAKVAHVFILVAVLFFIGAWLILMFSSESSISTERGKVSLRHFWPLLNNPAVLQASLAALALMI